MNKYRYFLILPALMAGVSLLSAFSGGYPSGAPAGYTGSPGDSKNCTSCHGGTAATIDGWITSDIPAEGYTPGNTYNITVTVPGSGNKGFEVSPQNPVGTLLGTLTAGTGSHLTGSGKYVTQSSQVSGNPATWTFSWTAPLAGTGDVTFYGAFAITTSTTRLSTLTVQEHSTLGIGSEAAPTRLVTVTPNPGPGLFRFTFRDDVTGVVTVRVHDLQGSVVRTAVTQDPGRGNSISLDLRALPAGIYLAEVSAEHHRQVLRLVLSSR